MGSDSEHDSDSEYTSGLEYTPPDSEHNSDSEYTSDSEYAPPDPEDTSSSSEDTTPGSEYNLSSSDYSPEPRENWHFIVIAKVDAQYYQIAQTKREEISSSELLSACLNARELFQAPQNAYALRSERNSTRLNGIKHDIIRPNTTNDLPFTTTCLELGLGFEKYKSLFSTVAGRFIFDITNVTDIRYGIKLDITPTIQCVRDYINHYLKWLGPVLEEELCQFDTWRVISPEAAYYFDTNSDRKLDEYTEAERIEYFLRSMDEAERIDYFLRPTDEEEPLEPISQLKVDTVILGCPKLNAIHNNAHWLRTGLKDGKREFQMRLLVSAFRGKCHVDLSRFNLNLNAAEIVEVIAELSLEESTKIQLLDLSGIQCLDSKDLESILTHLPDLESLLLLNTPQIPLNKKISLLKKTRITEFYDTEYFTTGSRSGRRSKFVEFIWWRGSKSHLIFRLPHMLDQERIISALSSFSRNPPFNLPDSEAADIFRYGFATSTNSGYKVHPIPVWNKMLKPSPLEKNRHTIILLSIEQTSSAASIERTSSAASIERTSSVAYVWEGKASVVSFEDVSEFMNKKLELNDPKPKFTELRTEDLQHAIQDLGIAPVIVPGSSPDS